MTKDERKDILEQLRHAADWMIKARGLMKALDNDQFDEMVEKFALEVFGKLDIRIAEEAERIESEKEEKLRLQGLMEGLKHLDPLEAGAA